jgi:hypothetical protein
MDYFMPHLNLQKLISETEKTKEEKSGIAPCLLLQKVQKLCSFGAFVWDPVSPYCSVHHTERKAL